MSDADFDRVIAQLHAIERMCSELGRATSISIDLDDESTQKAIWLQNTGRPFFEVTQELARHVEQAMGDHAARVFDSHEGTASAAELFLVGGEALREHVLLRFATQGFDVALTPLSTVWLERKRRTGFSALIGVYTGLLRNAVQLARIRFVMV